MSKSKTPRNVQLPRYNPLDNVDDRLEVGQRAILIVVTLLVMMVVFVDLQLREVDLKVEVQVDSRQS